MKYKELLEQLNKLSPEQLEYSVVFLAEENGYGIAQLEILKENLYINEEYQEDGLVPLELGQDLSGMHLIYSLGRPILIEEKYCIEHFKK